MDLESIKTILETFIKKEELNGHLRYSIGGYCEDAYCLDFNDKGMWEVYSGERGNKYDLQTFTSPKDACVCFIKELCNTHDEEQEMTEKFLAIYQDKGDVDIEK